MLTLTSAKRVIRLLICFNVVTILASVTLISSGMLIANANGSNKQKACITSTHSKLSNLSLNGDYSGFLLNSESKKLDSFSITFTTTPGSNPASVSLSNISFTPVGQLTVVAPGGGIPMDLTGATGVGNDLEQTTIFTITSQDSDDSNFPVIIQFQVVGASSSTSILGTWKVTNSGSKYTGFAGNFTLHKG